MNLTEKQKGILAADGHLLVTGGPGSGKTTISILKAAQVVDEALCPGQRVLFLSFARATVSRVAEAIQYEHKLPSEQRKRIEVETYHSFLANHQGSRLSTRPATSPHTSSSPAEAIALSSIRNHMGLTQSWMMPGLPRNDSAKAQSGNGWRWKKVGYASTCSRVTQGISFKVASEYVSS